MGKPLSKPSKKTPGKKTRNLSELSKSAKEKYSLEIAETNYNLHHQIRLCEEANGIVSCMKRALDYWNEILAETQDAVDYYDQEVTKINKKYNVYEYVPKTEITFTTSESKQDLPF